MKHQTGKMKTISTGLLLFISVLFSSQNNFAQVCNWQQTTTPPGGSIWALAAIGNNLFAGTNSGMYFSSDYGATWQPRNPNFAPTMAVRSFATNGNDLYVGSEWAGIYKTSDYGLSWTDVTPTGLSGNVRALAISGNDIFAGTIAGQVPIRKSPLNNISTSSWSSFVTGSLNVDVRSLAISGSSIFAGTYGNGVLVSPTSNAAWTSSSNGMNPSSDYIEALAVNGSNVLAGNISGNPVAYRSSDDGANWIQSSVPVFSNEPVYDIIYDNSTAYAGTEGAGVLLSNDNGGTWADFNQGFKDNLGNWYCNQINIRSFAIISGTLFAGVDCGVWKTPISPGLCTASVNFAMQKDSASLPAIVWDAIPNYPGNITAAEWSWGDGSSTAALYPAHTYSAEGLYNICVSVTVSCGATATSCANSSIYKTSSPQQVTSIAKVNVINLSPTALKNNSIQNIETLIYPNPGKGEFQLKLNGIQGKNIEIGIYSVTGQKVFSSTETNSNGELIKRINLGELQNGIYFLQINSENSIHTSKLILSK
jgi:hypothetical protein